MISDQEEKEKSDNEEEETNLQAKIGGMTQKKQLEISGDYE